MVYTSVIKHPDELLEAINKFLHRTQRDSLKQLNTLLSHSKKSNNLSFQKIALPILMATNRLHLII